MRNYVADTWYQTHVKWPEIYQINSLNQLQQLSQLRTHTTNIL